MSDLGTAFSAPFKDPDWAAKFLVGGIVVLSCITGLGFFVLAGYYIELTRRVMRREQYPLPEWTDLGVKFITGVKYAAVILLYILPVVLLAVPMVVLMVLTTMSDPGGTPGILASIYLFAYVLLVVPYSILLMLLTPIIAYRFAERESIAHALDVSAIFRMFTRNWESTLVVALVGAGIESLAGLGVFGLFIGIFFTIFYTYLVAAFLHGLLYLDHQKSQEAVPA